MKKNIARLIYLLVAVMIGGGAVWTLTSPGKKGRDRADAPAYITVSLGSVDETVTAQGKLEPKEYVDVGTQVSGQLKTLHVDVGHTVKKGQLLAEIDPRIYESRAEANQAKLKTQKAALAEQLAQQVLAEQKYARNKRLIESKAISQEALEETDAERKAAAARADSIRAQIEEISSTLRGDMTNLEFTKIYAPIDGVVATLTARQGQTLNANQTAPIILRVADLDMMTVRAQVAEADVMRLTAGMPAYFTTLGMMDKKWQGVVRQIWPSPEVINEVVLYNVLIDVDNHDRLLMNGMSTQIFFQLGEAKDVPVIPVEALGRRMPAEDTDAGPAYKVQVLTEDEPEERTVHIGRMNRQLAQVLDGLVEGEKVMLPVKPDKKRGSSGGGPPFGGGGPRL